jgi:hypothetical protein
MDQDDQHHYPPNYPNINPQYLEYIQGQLQGTFQEQLQSIQQAAQERLANAEVGWMKILEENRKREAFLQNQVKVLSKQLEVIVIVL